MAARKAISLDLLKDVLIQAKQGRSFITFFKQEIANSTLKESTRRNHPFHS